MHLFKKINHIFDSKQQIVNLLITLFFIACVYPFSFNVGGQGVSGNYLFVFFPLLYYLYSRQLNWPKLSTVFFLLLLTCIFLVAFLLQSEYMEYSIRRIASFIIFMSIFAFMFVKIDFHMISSIKYAIVIFSLYSSIFVLNRYIDLGGEELASHAKGQIGSTRIGFIYIMALWIVFFLNPKSFFFFVLKHSAAIVIIIGLLLTYNRSSMFSLFFSTLVYLITITFGCIKDGQTITMLLKKIFISVAYIITIVVLIGSLFPGTISDYKRYYSYIIPFEYTEMSTQSDQTLTTQSDQTLTTQTGADLKTQFDNVMNNSESRIQKIIGAIKIANINSKNTATFQGMNDCLVACSVYERIVNRNTSEGYRIYMVSKIKDFVFENPLTGSGFLGVWIMFDEIKGSAHSQYLDVLFRLGIVGFFFYLYIIFKILKFLYTKDKGLFLGFFGMLFYGFLHETFKLSQGAFIFAFLYAMYDQRETSSKR